MNQHLIAALFAVAFAVSSHGQTVQAQPPAPLSPKAQLAADNKAAAARYQADKALCNDETDSNARLQCRRDARVEYDAALAAAKARLAAATPAAVTEPAGATAQAACPGCGRVYAVSMKEQAGKGGPVGMIAGGVGGALLGRQIGGGSGRDLATIGGAVAGAYAGKKIEEKVTTHKVWTVTVDYPNHSKRNFQFDKDPGFNVGDPVRNSGGSIVRR